MLRQRMRGRCYERGKQATMANTHPCPSCDELVDSEASVCPHCGATLSGSVLTLQEEASSAQNTEPIAAPPASQAPLGINLASDNDNALVPPPQKPDHAHRPSNPWWTVAFATLGVILILGTIFLLAHQPTTPAVVAPHPTATTAPSPTATSIPQAHVVIQLENVFSKDSRDFFSADSFYIKSTLSAPGTDREISSYKVTNHYNINQGETTNFGAGDQVIFDANILLSGNVTGSMSAYTNDDNNPLGSTDIKFS